MMSFGSRYSTSWQGLELSRWEGLGILQNSIMTRLLSLYNGQDLDGGKRVAPAGNGTDLRTWMDLQVICLDGVTADHHWLNRACRCDGCNSFDQLAKYLGSFRTARLDL